MAGYQVPEDCTASIFSAEVRMTLSLYGTTTQKTMNSKFYVHCCKNLKYHKADFVCYHIFYCNVPSFSLWEELIT
jgi:hypothetical protein